MAPFSPRSPCFPVEMRINYVIVIFISNIDSNLENISCSYDSVQYLVVVYIRLETLVPLYYQMC
jgi:hypothetical protein